MPRQESLAYDLSLLLIRSEYPASQPPTRSHLTCTLLVSTHTTGRHLSMSTTVVAHHVSL